MYFRAEGVLTGEWDVNRLRQAISNLLANAIQHGSENAPIRLSVISEGPDVLITVYNGEPAIPSGDLATIFDPLVRGSSSHAKTHGRPGSIGLGLYIAREVVGAHGGAIGVTSCNLAGTIFTIRLPRRGLSCAVEPSRGATQRPAA